MKVNLNRINNAFHYEASTKDSIKVYIDANPVIGGEGKGGTCCLRARGQVCAVQFVRR